MIILFLLSLLVVQIHGFKLERYNGIHAMRSMVLQMSEERTINNKKIFIFGLGYVGTAFARYLKNQGWTVAGTCTNVNKAIELRNEGIKTSLFDELSISKGQTDVTEDILTSNCVLSTIPPILPNRDLVLEAYSDELRQAAFKYDLKWIGYLSSTGVYGDCGGAWVKEDRPPSPDNEKTKARAEVENYWYQLSQRSGLPVHIFRLAGIYGPGRSVIDTLLKFPQDSLKSPADDNTFVSRIHIDDILQVLAASIRNPKGGEIYNVADDLPSTRYDVLSYICRLYNLPDVELTKLSDKDKASRGGSKRVDNAKIRKLLQDCSSSLIYSDYRSGLSALAPSYQKQIEERFIQPKYQQTEISRNLTSTDSQENQIKRDEVKDLKGRIAELENKVESLEKNQAIIMNALNQINEAIKSL